MLSPAGSPGRRIHPYTALIVVAWSFASIYLGFYIEPLILSVILSLYSGTLKRLAPIYAWVTIPVALIVALVSTPIAAVEAGLRLLALVMITTSTLTLIDPLELGYSASRAGLPPMAGFIVPITLRITDYLAGALREVRAAMRGRGIKGGLRQVLLLPIPLVVHAFNVSTYIAEALSFKYPPRDRSWHVKPGFRGLDWLLVLYILSSAIGRMVYIILGS